ncbi:protein maelstrom homolog [Styela clava]
MPKKKQAPKNAFSFYLDDMIPELRQKGINIRGKHEAVPHVHRMWKELTQAEKSSYEERARQWKITKSERPFRPGRLDCTGNPLENRIDMDKMILDQRKEQKKLLLDKWQSIPKDQVLDEHVYIISFQSFFEFPNEEGYQPCEVSCVDYTLRSGIKREWHAMIDPGPIKRGLAAESKIFSERTHNIPVFGFDLARNDYLKLWRDLLEFVNHDNLTRIYPPLFSKLSELKKNLFCLDYLAQAAGVSNRLSKVYQWEGLASALYQHAGIQSPSINIIEDGSSTTMYDYEANTKCDYHDEIECVYCSLLTVKKCCFWMSDAFSKIFNYEITERHLPVRQAPEYTIINPEDIHVDGVTKRRFMGASSAQRYDSNLPLNLQNNTLADISRMNSSSFSSAFGSRDIRYRPKYHLVEPKISFGRGMVIPGRQPPMMTDDNLSTMSVTDTNDDVNSMILSDVESDTTCQADDESESIYSLSRAPKTTPFVVDALKNYRNLSIMTKNPERSSTVKDLAASSSKLNAGSVLAINLTNGANDSDYDTFNLAGVAKALDKSNNKMQDKLDEDFSGMPSLHPQNHFTLEHMRRSDSIRNMKNSNKKW